MKKEIEKIIARHRENIRRLEATIAAGYWPEGYIKNCQIEIASYKQEIEKLNAWEIKK